MSDDVLQFDRAEYDQAAGAAQCARCQQSLMFSYYQVNAEAVCQACADALRAERARGSRASRVARAAGAGFGAAVLGFVLYYAITVLTGYEFGLIAIAVGFGVGAAVRWGSYGRGGWAYQSLAIALTYLAIVSTYIPPVIKSLRSAAAQTSASANAGGDAGSSTATNPAAAAETPLTAPQFALAIALLVLLVCAAPFLAGFQNAIGILIIGIGLYEAWKLNRRTPFEITGPHPVVTAAAAV